jgi:hypothetical protein
MNGMSEGRSCVKALFITAVKRYYHDCSSSIYLFQWLKEARALIKDDHCIDWGLGKRRESGRDIICRRAKNMRVPDSFVAATRWLSRQMRE